MNYLHQRVFVQIPVDVRDWQNVSNEVKWPTRSFYSEQELIAEMLNWGASTSLKRDNISVTHQLMSAMRTEEKSPFLKSSIGIWACWSDIALSLIHI